MNETNSPDRPSYRSRFGGFWTDLSNAHDLVAQKLEAGAFSEDEAETLRHWIDHGWVILRNAVAPEVVDQVKDDVEKAWTGAFSSVWVEYHSYHVLRTSKARPDLRHRAAKMLDLYIDSAAARNAMFADPIRRFLNLVFERAPMAFQSLTFIRGSEQAIHQDTAYVVVSSPIELAASWIALEDIVPGSGELLYYDGSHKIEEFLFQGKNKNMEPDDPDHGEFLASLHEKSKALGCEMKTFLPKKGDALIWSADLAHGGAPIESEEQTRKSLVTHYCPVDRDPGYFRRGPGRHSEKIKLRDDAYYCYTVQGG